MLQHKTRARLSRGLATDLHDETEHAIRACVAPLPRYAPLAVRDDGGGVMCKLSHAIAERS